MAILAPASSPPAAMPRPASAPRSPKTVAATKPRCSSESERIDSVQNRVGASGFLLEDFEGGQIGVPFDERGLGTESFDRLPVERPDRRSDARPVRIDEARPRVVVAREMDFRHRIAGYRRHIVPRIETVVH